MHSSSLFLFAVILIIALHSLPISGKAVKQTATTTTTTTTTTTLTPTTKILTIAKVPAKAITTTTTLAPTTKILTIAKVPAKAPASKVVKKKKAPAKKSKKPKQSPWKVPDADQKKLFNDYKTILRTKLNARNLNISATYQLEPAKYGSEPHNKTILNHYLIKLPDSKYAHAIIGTTTDAKKPTPVNESNASIRRTIYDNLAAAEAAGN